MEHDFYATLGVSKDASQEDIQKAYRKLSRQYHPDKNSGDPAAEEKFKSIAEAYGILKDSDRRRKYDRGFDPIESVQDLFRRHPYGQRLVAAMLPSAPAAPKPGVDKCFTIVVDPKVHAHGGEITIEVPPRFKGGPTTNIRLTLLQRMQWCQVSGLGTPGRNGAPNGDLWIRLVPKKKGKT